MAPRVPAFYLEPGLKPIPANASGSAGRPGYARIEDSIAKTEAGNALFNAGHPHIALWVKQARASTLAKRSRSQEPSEVRVTGARDDRVRDFDREKALHPRSTRRSAA
jgi:hypothetical protein